MIGLSFSIFSQQSRSIEFLVESHTCCCCRKRSRIIRKPVNHVKAYFKLSQRSRQLRLLLFGRPGGPDWMWRALNFSMGKAASYPSLKRAQKSMKNQKPFCVNFCAWLTVDSSTFWRWFYYAKVWKRMNWVLTLASRINPTSLTHSFLAVYLNPKLVRLYSNKGGSLQR